MEINNLSIAGVSVTLEPISRSELQGLNIDTILKFSFYKANFNNQPLCIIRLTGAESLTPAKYKRYIEKIEPVVGMPVVVSLNSTMYVDRTRLIEQGVYFVASDSYVFLPTLLINTKVGKSKPKNNKTLTPASQYILLYCLQMQGATTFTIKELESRMPYNYLALSRGISELEQFGFCRSEKSLNGQKIVSLAYSGKELWEKAQEVLKSPVKKVVYSDEPLIGGYLVSGINALSHYSHLNPENTNTIAIWDKDFRDLEKSGLKTNETEGQYKIEIWSYCPEMPMSESVFVDKLSLYLSMKEDKDARVEKELYLLINEMKWYKD